MSAYESGNTHTYGYTNGRLTTLTAPGNRQWGFTYNDAGQPASYTWPNGMTTNYTYDTAGRLTGLEHKDGATVKAGWAYELSNDDNIVRVDDTRAGNGQAWEYEYDARGRLIHALRFNDSGLPQFRQAFAYDAADNLSSVTKFDLSQVVGDTFADGDYIANPAWTVWSGTWSAASYYLAPAPEAGQRAISAASTTRSPDLRVDYYLPQTLNSLFDNFSVYVRYVNTTNHLRVMWALGSLFVIETVNGTETYLATYTSVSATMNSWQTLYVQLQGDNLRVYHAPQGKAPRLLGGEIAVNSSMNTTQFRLAVGGQSGFRFDNVAVHSRSLDVEGTTAHTYNSANQLVTSTTNGVVTNHTYDPWGRLSTRTQGAYAASYEWRYGDKLKAVTSNFPGEAALVAYDYDGLGKRRSRTTGAGMTWWRWGLGWDTLAEYTDPDTDGDIEGFSKFNVMMGMMHPLAEASVPSGQPPANAAYSYLALDHLSSTRAVFSQAKAQTAAMEFYPYGGRLSTSGTLPHHQFTAKPYDTGTGQYYFPYRYYSPAMARWTAADPAGTVDGPNVYGYAGGEPVSFFDALGLQIHCQPTYRTKSKQTDLRIVGYKYDIIWRTLCIGGFDNNMMCRIFSLTINHYRRWRLTATTYNEFICYDQDECGNRKYFSDWRKGGDIYSYWWELYIKEYWSYYIFTDSGFCQWSNILGRMVCWRPNF